MSVMVLVLILFFFQAEDGIRDDLVTGVQTCALPISRQPDTNCSSLLARVWVRRESYRGRSVNSRYETGALDSAGCIGSYRNVSGLDFKCLSWPRWSVHRC